MKDDEYSSRYCVIGAGAAGLAVAKNFREKGIPFDVIERHAGVAGLWGYGRSYSAIYKSTRLISSRSMSEFRDFPMDKSLPDYPGQEAVFRYFNAYADAFGLRQSISFNTEITSATRSGNFWDIRLQSGEMRRYRGLVLASGVTWDPKVPDLKGEFNGDTLHSVNYKEPDRFVDKKVLVIGGGNSGFDIAAELGRHTRQTFISVRRGYHFIPRYVFGIPSDQFGEFSTRMGTPLVVRQFLNQLIVRLQLGNPVKLGLPKPNHRMFESHPIINAEVLDEIRKGNVTAKADIRELRGTKVLFADGSEEVVDSIIYATGYRISYPYIDQSHLNGPSGKPNFYLHLFHPIYDNLFTVGMIQPASGVWSLMDDQARLISAYIQAANSAGSIAAMQFDRTKAGPQPDMSGGIRYIDSERHFTEVDHTVYRRHLERHLQVLEKPAA
ncbi:MAG: monooxygenase [Methylococcus sp.]|nr:MAG: monooxygenase [Methylococcus sp.]